MNLYYSFGYFNVPNSLGTLGYFHIIRDCQELKEVYLGRIRLSEGDLTFLAKTISPKVEKIDLSYSWVNDYHVKIILSRCKEIKTLHLRGCPMITNDLVIKLLDVGHVCVRVRLSQNEYMKSSKNDDVIYSF